MCRRCGEPDRRGNSTDRKRRALHMLARFGNGVICPCSWCGDLLGLAPGRLHVGGRYLPIVKLEQDRLEEGGPYALWNLVPACGPCNRARHSNIPEGCEYGGGGPRVPYVPPLAVEAMATSQSGRITLPLDSRTGPPVGDRVGQIWDALARHHPDVPIAAWPHYYGEAPDQPIAYALVGAAPGAAPHGQPQGPMVRGTRPPTTDDPSTQPNRTEGSTAP